MKCEYCPKEFIDNMDGLAIKTFHEILKHAREIHKDYDKDNIISGQEWYISHPHQNKHGRFGK